MATLNTKVKKYLEANSKVYLDELDNFLLQNDGSGDFIKSWNVSGLSKPTNEQLTAQETSANIEENNNVVRGTRREAYGNIGDQLDEIYKNIDSWKARIKSIKDANPKA
jgi:hypothetical protein